MDIPGLLTYLYPNAAWTHRGNPDDYAGLDWVGPGAKPSLAQLQASVAGYVTAKAQEEGRRTLEVEGGIGALIASLENEDYDRDLEPAKVRLALALLTKRLIDPSPIVVTAEQLAALENGIVRLFAHLNPG